MILPDLAAGFLQADAGHGNQADWTLLVSIYTIITVLSIGGGWLPGYLDARGWSVTWARKTGMFVFAP